MTYRLDGASQFIKRTVGLEVSWDQATQSVTAARGA